MCSKISGNKKTNNQIASLKTSFIMIRRVMSPTFLKIDKLSSGISTKGNLVENFLFPATEFFVTEWNFRHISFGFMNSLLRKKARNWKRENHLEMYVLRNYDFLGNFESRLRHTFLSATIHIKETKFCDYSWQFHLCLSACEAIKDFNIITHKLENWYLRIFLEFSFEAQHLGKFNNWSFYRGGHET